MKVTQKDLEEIENEWTDHLRKRADPRLLNLRERMLDLNKRVNKLKPPIPRYRPRGK